jgi:hypothetical protein
MREFNGFHGKILGIILGKYGNMPYTWAFDWRPANLFIGTSMSFHGHFCEVL